MPQLHYEITGSSAQLQRTFDQVRQATADLTSDMERSGQGVEQMFNKIKTAAAAAAAGFSAKAFITQVAQTRGQFQQLEMAFKTMLGSESQANAMMEQMVRTAATTPFDLQGVAGGAKQLLAYGLEADKVNDTLIRLGDIAAGLSIPLNDIVYLYGTTMVQGRMYTQDLNQFTGRGIPLIGELAKQFGVADSEVKNLVTEGKVGFPEVEKAIISLTSEGGKFGGLMSNQSGTISGQIANIEDSIDMMFNDMGKQSEGVINTTLELVSKLVENWRTVADVLTPVVAGIGMYKASLLVVHAAEKQRTADESAAQAKRIADLKAEQSKLEEIALQKQALLDADDPSKVSGVSEVAKTASESSEEGVAYAGKLMVQKELNAQLDAEIAKRTQIAQQELADATQRHEDAQLELDLATEDNDKAQEALDLAKKNKEQADAKVKAAEEYLDKVKSADVEGGDDAADSIGSAEADLEIAKREQAAAATELETAAEQANTTQKQLNKSTTLEQTTAEEVNTAQTRVNTLQKEQQTIAEKANTTSTAANTTTKKAATTTEKLSTAAKIKNYIATKTHTAYTKASTQIQLAYKSATEACTKSVKKLWAAMKANPLGLVLSLAGSLVALLLSVSDSEDEASAATERFGESAAKALTNIQTLEAVIRSTDENSKVHQDAVEELCKIYEEYGVKIDEEKDKLEQLRDAHDQVTDAIKREGIERQKANAIQTYEDAITKNTEEMKEKLLKAFQNAEWEGSGTFDDWDADEYQKRASQLSIIIGGIIEAEGEGLARLAAQGGDEYEQAVQKVIEKIRKELEVEGLPSFTTTNTNVGDLSSIVGIVRNVANGGKKFLDVDIKGYIEDYAKGISEITAGRDNLIKTYKEEERNIKSTQNTTNEEIDYSKQKFGDLAEAAFGAGKVIESVGKKDVKPNIDARAIEEAKKKTDEIMSNLNLINGMTATATVKIDLTDPNGVANYLNGQANNPNSTPTNGKGKGKGTNNKPNNGMLPKHFWEYGKGEEQPKLDQKKSLAQLQADLKEAVKTSNGVDNLLTQVNDKLGDAEYGTALYKGLVKMKKQLNKAKSKFDSDGKNKKQTGLTDAQKDEEEQEKQASINRKWAEEQEKEAAERQYAYWQAEIDAMKEGSAKKLAQLELDHQKELDDLDRQAEETKKSYVDHAKSLWDTDRHNKGKDFYKSKEYEEANKLTADDDAYFSQKAADAEKKYKKDVADVYREEAEAMRSYLKDYGTFQQQRLAIAEEYAEKIKKAQEGGDYVEARRLKKEQEQKIEAVNISALKQEIDWSGVLGDFSNLFRDQLKPQLDHLVAYSQSADFQKASVQDQQSIYDLISKLRAATSEGWSGMFKDLGEKTTAYQDAQNKKTEAELKAAQATAELTEAQKKHLRSDGTVDTANEEVKAAFEKSAQAADNLTQANQNLHKAQNDLTDAATRVRTNMNDLVNGLNGLKSDSLSGVWSGADSLAKVFGEGDLSGKVAKSLGKVVGGALGGALGGELGGEILNSIFGILDILADGIENLVANLIDTVLGSINGILNSALNLKHNVETIGGSLVSNVGSILNTVTWGGFHSWTRGNGKEVAERIADLTQANDDLQKAIEANTEALDESNGGIKSLIAAQKAVEAQQETNENYKKIAQERASYHESHHSWQYYWGGLTAEQMQTAASNGIENFNGDIWSLTPEEMKKLLSDVSVRESIRSTGKGGYGESVLSALDDYADQADAIDDIYDKLNELNTQTSFDDLRSNFLDTLMDMDADAEDFADDMTKTLTQAMLNTWLSDVMEDKIKKFYESYAKAAEDGLTASEVSKYQSDWQELVEEGLAKRDQIVEITGYTGDSDTEQSTTYGSASNITQDQMDEFNGRVTALQVQGEVRNTSLDSIANGVLQVINFSAQLQGGVEQLTLLAIDRNDYLADIAKQTKKGFEMLDSRLAKVETYTSRI